MEWMRHKIPQIKDVLPITNGIFGHCNYNFKYNISKAHLDFLLLAKIGQRNPAPVIDVLHEQNEEEMDEMLTSAELTTLAEIMVMTYKQKWDKLGEVYDIEYDPIHNYLDQWEDESESSGERNRTENVDRVDTLGTTVEKSSTRTDNLSELITKDGTDTTTRTDDLTEVAAKDGSDTATRTDDLEETVTNNLADGNTRTHDTDKANTGTVTMSGSDVTTDALWGFNSSSAVNSDKSTLEHGQTRTDNLNEAMTGTVTDSGTHTGTVTTENDGTETTQTAYNSSVTTTNEGTATTEVEYDSTVTTANTGTQGIVASEETTGTNRRDLDTTEEETTEDTRTRSGKHSGNIGNLTSQKQILEEIELWKWNYVEQILDDAKEFLSLSVYMC